jgi:hypothetical protein
MKNAKNMLVVALMAITSATYANTLITPHIKLKRKLRLQF